MLDKITQKRLTKDKKNEKDFKSQYLVKFENEFSSIANKFGRKTDKNTDS